MRCRSRFRGISETAAAVLLLFLLPACHAIRHESAVPLRGRLVLEVEPNPIPALPLGEDFYELKFDIIMREAGGVAVRIEDFSLDAVAFKTVTVRSQTFPASYITDRGFPAAVQAGKYLRFSFVKRWNLPTYLLLSGASARVSARTIDDHGVRGDTVTRVGIVVVQKAPGR